MRTVLLAIVSATLAFGASKTELELKAKLAAAQAKLVAAEKENAILQEALKNSASDHAQLAAAARDKNQIKASLDALTAQARNSQQETGRIATQAANQAAGQASLAAAQLALRNKAELAKAVALVNASNKRQADNAARVADDAVAVNEATAADVKESVKTSNAAVNTSVTKVADKMDDMALRIEETKQAAHHQNLLLYLAALGSIATPVVQFMISKLTRAAVQKAAKDGAIAGNQPVLAAVAEGTASSKGALAAANHMTTKVSDMRADLVAAVKATNAQTAAASAQRDDIRQDLASLHTAAETPV